MSHAVRAILIGGLVGLLVGLGIVVVVMEDTRGELVRGCDRGDYGRVFDEELGELIIGALRQDHEGPDDRDAEDLQEMLDRYVKAYAPVAEKPGHLKVDCEKAYPSKIPAFLR